MDENSSTTFLLLICCAPYIFGIISGLLMVARFAEHGWWGLLPLGGLLKKFWMKWQG